MDRSSDNKISMIHIFPQLGHMAHTSPTVDQRSRSMNALSKALRGAAHGLSLPLSTSCKPNGNTQHFHFYAKAQSMQRHRTTTRTKVD